MTGMSCVTVLEGTKLVHIKVILGPYSEKTFKVTTFEVQHWDP